MSEHTNPNNSTNTPAPVTSNRDVSTEPTGNRRRDPFSMFNDIELMMDRMLGRRWPLFRSLPGVGDMDVSWNPQVDMYEQGNELVIKAELPGVSRDDIDVSIEKGDLILKGERKSEHEVKDENAYRLERSFGSFYRRLPLPDDVKEDDISATYNDGVLEIRMPKPAAETTSAKKIAIS
jgi:HSP20 family protein